MNGKPFFDIRLNAMGQIIVFNLCQEDENAHLTAEYASFIGTAAIDVLDEIGGHFTLEMPAFRMYNIKVISEEARLWTISVLFTKNWILKY